MNLCDDGHIEICYQGNACPVCELKKEVETLEDEISGLRLEIQEIKEDQ